jgi:hypothetical protein
MRKYPSCKKVLKEVKKIMKISLVNTNEKKRCILVRYIDRIQNSRSVTSVQQF